MKQLPFLLIIIYTTLVSGHGGCISNEDCTMQKNHSMNVNETMQEECCAFLSYTENGTNIQTNKICMSTNDMKEYYDNYKQKVGATKVAI